MASATQLAVIRIRGEVNIHREVARTLTQLHIERKHYCTIVPQNPSYAGMINKVENYVTWGEIDDDTHKQLIATRGEETTIDGKKTRKPFFRLAPPRKGFERKGTKKSYSDGGALGYRGASINNLIKRMI